LSKLFSVYLFLLTGRLQCHCSRGELASISASGMWSWKVVTTRTSLSPLSTGTMRYVVDVVCTGWLAVAKAHQVLLAVADVG